MNSQREFNEYITEKVNAISHLFGTKIIRNETINEDEYKYVRPYKKTISPFYSRSICNNICKCRKSPS